MARPWLSLIAPPPHRAYVALAVPLRCLSCLPCGPPTPPHPPAAAAISTLCAQFVSTRQLSPSVSGEYSWVVGPLESSGMSLGLTRRTDKLMLTGRLEVGSAACRAPCAQPPPPVCGQAASSLGGALPCEPSWIVWLST